MVQEYHKAQVLEPGPFVEVRVTSWNINGEQSLACKNVLKAVQLCL